MTTVDSEGRIVLPKDVCERLGIVPGTEVEIHEEDGKVIVTPEDDPGRIIERMERLIAEAAANRESTPLSDEELHPIAQKHADTVRQRAQKAEDDDE